LSWARERGRKRSGDEAGGGSMAQRHDHPAEMHSHTHHHVVHYKSHGEDWSHLEATHDHEHNHSPVQHEHQPHEDQEQEHQREAHIHDHASPAESPG
jgi:hypothetical protein